MALLPPMRLINGSLPIPSIWHILDDDNVVEVCYRAGLIMNNIAGDHIIQWYCLCRYPWSWRFRGLRDSHHHCFPSYCSLLLRILHITVYVGWSQTRHSLHLSLATLEVISTNHSVPPNSQTNPPWKPSHIHIVTLDLEEMGMHHDDSLAKLQSPKQVARLLGPLKHLLNITSCQPIMS